MTEPSKEAMEIWGRAVGAHEMAKFRMSDIPDIAAALVIQEALAERDAWQPIETAPMDGTWVLCWGPDCEHSVAIFSPNPCWPEYPEYTHWMPLPTPPAEGRTDD